MTQFKNLSCVVLAAGQSTRMRGQNKHLLPIGGLTVLEKTLLQALEYNWHELLVILGHQNEAIQESLKAHRIQNARQTGNLKFIVNERYKFGMHSSIRKATESLSSNSEGMILCLGDQPFSLTQRLEKLLGDASSAHQRLIRSVHKGEPGHPVLIGRSFFRRIQENEDGDYGCSYLFKESANRCVLVEQDVSSTWDLDSPEDFDLAKLREIGRL